jgi:twinkle protein
VITDDEIDFKKYLQETEPKMRVRPASAYIDEVRRMFGDTSIAGDLLPWAKCSDMIGFRPGEVSIWAGINGHGKSLLTGQVALWFVARDVRTIMLSFEMRPATTLKRMARQCSGGAAPTDSWLDKFAIWTHDRLWFYDQQGVVDWKIISAVVRYCVEKHQIKHFFIDSLMKTIRGDDDYNAQKDAIDLACTLARDLDVHLHIVHHIRKSSDERARPGKFDLKGSSAISDQADNVLIVHRMKWDDDERLDKNGSPKPDVSLTIAKQRNGEFEGKIALWFDPRSQQFLCQPHARPADPMQIRGV